jgi:hypoxanthine phosphoribosyltransferase
LNRHPITSNEFPAVTLAGFPALAGQLAMRVRAARFAPTVIVYVERGARLLAVELCREFSCGAIAVSAARRGGRVKRALANLASRLPRSWRDALRRADQRWLWRGEGEPRPVRSDFSGSLAHQRVLLVDDAADSGRTIAGCLAWLASHGAPRDAVRVAVLAATTPAGRAAVDDWVLERNTRLPWSSDSPDRAAAEAAWAAQRPPPFP